MTLQCNHPRPPFGEIPDRASGGWKVRFQPPSYLPGLPVETAQRLMQAFNSIAQELGRLGSRGATVPLLDAIINARSGQTIQGIADGQTVRLPTPVAGATEPVRIIVDSVRNPVRVELPDGTVATLAAVGAYDFYPTTSGESYVAGPDELTGSTTVQGNFWARASAGTGPFEAITSAQAADLLDSFLATLMASASVVASGSTFQRAALTGDVTAAQNSNVTAISANAVTNLALRDSSALSVIGRSANSVGDPADITATAASGAVLRESGSTVGFGQVATAGIADNAVTDAKLRQGAARSVIGRTASSTGPVADIAATSLSGHVLREDSSGGIGFGLMNGATVSSGTLPTNRIAAISSPRVLANVSGASASPTETTLSAVLDAAITNNVGEMIFRASGVWSNVAAGSSGQFLRSRGAVAAGPEWVNADQIPGTLIAVTRYTSGSGTHTYNAQTSRIVVELVGGGGGGGGVYDTDGDQGSGGGAGAFLRLHFTSFGASSAYSVGAGGNGGLGQSATVGASSGVDGGDTTLVISGVTYQAGKGLGGGVSGLFPYPGFGGVPSHVFPAAEVLTYSYGNHGTTGNFNEDQGGYGGSGPFGGGGRSGLSYVGDGAGLPGRGPGSGGGGGFYKSGIGMTFTDSDGGAGHAGVIIIMEYS